METKKSSPDKIYWVLIALLALLWCWQKYQSYQEETLAKKAFRVEVRDSTDHILPTQAFMVEDGDTAKYNIQLDGSVGQWQVSVLPQGERLVAIKVVGDDTVQARMPLPTSVSLKGGKYLYFSE